MNKLLHRLFGRGSSVHRSRPPQDVSDPARLRQAVDGAATASDRALRERELGEMLGRASVAPTANDSPNVWVAAICCTTDPRQALTWVDGVTDEAALERLARDSRSTQVRLAAARRIADVQRLQKLAEAMRDKDRGVYRYCQSVLKTHADQARRADQIAGVCQRLRQVMDATPLPAAPLCELRKLIAQLGDGEDLAECRALLDQANRLEQEQVAQRRKLETARTRAEGLLATLAGDPRPGVEQLDAWKDAARQLAHGSASLPAWLAGEKPFADLSRALTVIDDQLRRLNEDVARVRVCRQFLADHPVVDPDSELARAWHELPKPENQAVRNELTKQWTVQSTQAQRQRPTAAAPSSGSPGHFTEVRTQLTALERAIANGETRRAFSVAKSLDQLVADAELPRTLAEQYRRVQKQLFHLRDWARWSGGQAREQLIAAAEALLAEPVDIEHLAGTVPQLRAAWKRLERLDGDSRASAAQWTRFDQTLARAYQPVLSDRAERSARQEAACEVKTAFLAQAEQWFESINWQAAKVGEIQQQVFSLRQRWRGLSPAGSRDERKLSARYRALMAALDVRIQPCVDLEFDRRRCLVAAANRLEQVADSGEAVSQARALQQRWREEAAGVRLPRTESEVQWQQFREALDRVFARRDAERRKREAKQRKQATARSSLLTDFEQKLQGRPELHNFEAALDDFRSQWNGEETTAERGERPRGDMSKKAAALIQHAEDAIRRLRIDHRREVLELIARKAALAEELEAAAASGQLLDDLSRRIQGEWQQAGSLPGEIERKLTARLNAAPAATSTKWAAGHFQRSELLIDLEILLDLPTPPELSEARRLRQLDFLQSGVQHLKTPSALMGMVSTWYGLAAAPDPAQLARIGKVTAKLQALTAAVNQTEPHGVPL